MRITRDTLLKIATETTAQRVRQDRGLVSILATGSLLDEEPLLGGATDIDLIFVHASQPPLDRELVRLNDEVHLDIAHLPQSLFSQPRQLRVDSWLGPAIYANPILLHDTQHWFEFTQASVRSQFNRPDYAIGRARPFAEQARRAWLQLREGSSEEADPHPAGGLHAYLGVLAGAANGIASLSGAPLTERRFLARLPERAQALGNTALSANLIDLLGGGQVEPDAVRSWLPHWTAAYEEAGQIPTASIRLHPFRKLYYERCFEGYLSANQPAAALWPLLRTWTLAVHSLPAGTAHLLPWLEACQVLGLDPANLSDPLGRLDSYLDLVEETLDRWAQENGL